MDIDYANIKDFHGRPAYGKDADGNWITDKYLDYKDCKKSGGNYTNKKGKDVAFKVKDVVWVDGHSTLTGKRVLGWFHFDSWDSYDNSFYVGNSPMRIFTYNVPMDAVYHKDSKEYATYLDNIK